MAATLVFAALIATPLVAATLQAPQPKGALYNPRDYPQSAMRNDEMGVARIRVTVSPKGKPIDCAVIYSSDTESLDKASCAVMLARGSYTPAQDATGQPLYGVVRRLVSWSFGLSSANHRAFEERNQPSDIDIIVTVTALPAGLVAPVAVIADVLVTPTGQIADCNADAGGAVPVELAQLACVQAKALSHAMPAVDPTGVAVMSVQQIKLAFITEPAAK
ncbi:TonB family protein [Polymorphobacter arshaanensis]|uniref:TonB family protein n=1 Tax=Glacieibacterium arshaanense TaxID=2511025 RepID=A0A4Y9ERM8_9SPHN|nr:TonB family protein [Polymorphobacter arshaanensis]TFU05829.1 TonB family protein [Polymorphobacter arshaanensis]